MKKRNPSKLQDKNLSQLKKKLDEVFSKWVKRNWSPDGIYVACYTCGRSMQVQGDSNCTAGHFISRTYSPTRYDENNVRPQCMWPCNTKVMGNGKPIEFERALKMEVGEEVVEEMKALSTTPYKFDRLWLIERIEYYKEQLSLME